MAKAPTLSKQVLNLTQRLHKLEAALSVAQSGDVDDRYDEDCGHEGGPGSCNLPLVPERTFSANVSSYREGLIRYIAKKWVNGTKLKYYFFDSGRFKGAADNVELVREAFEVWRDVGIGIEFEETTDINQATIRIGFLRGDGSWSYVGRDVHDIPGRHERTMNFGWDLTTDPRGGGLDTPVHEIGHTLGFPHAHQNPFSGITWDEEAVYAEFSGSPNFWSRQQTFHNILRKLNPREVEGSSWDPDSIMHYSFGPGLIKEPTRFRTGLNPVDGLTETDKSEALKFYPPLDARRHKKLTPMELEFLSLNPGDQQNYVIQPTHSDEFTIQTFGRSDTVMILFEEVDGELEFVAGDDDSGYDTNARISARLVRGRKYVLRIRLYLNWASGDTAVMMW